MQYRLISTSGIEASAVGLGTWAIGGWPWGGTDEQKAIEAIQASIDAGITLIDTAPAYGLGLSEEIVGKAIAGRRDKVVLAPKCGLVWHTDKGTHFFNEYGKDVYKYLGPESIEHEVEQSLKRLKTDCIDLYQTHWQDSTTSIEETMITLTKLKKQGKIRAVGVSNINVEQLKKYQKVDELHSAQEKYNMLDRELEDELLPYCKQQNISILAYSPMALGLLTGKIGPERQFTGDDLRINNPRFSVENRKKVIGMLNQFQPIAEQHNATIPQLVIAWTIAQPGITFALVGARNPEQAQKNAKAGEIVLRKEDLEKMNRIINSYRTEIT